MAALAFAGERVALRFSWGHLATFRDLYGAEFDTEIQRALSDFDVLRLAEILSVLTGRTQSEWMAESPPLVATVREIAEALSVSFHGPEGRAKIEAEAAEGESPFGMKANRFLAGLFARLRPGSKAAA